MTLPRIGLLLAVVLGAPVAVLALWIRAVNCCELQTRGAGMKIGALLFDVGAGAGIGALIDRAVKGRHTVYEQSVASPSAYLVPIVAPRGVGVAGAIRW